MRICKILFLACLLFAAQQAAAQESEQETSLATTIERQLEKDNDACGDENGSTHGMIYCNQRLYERWDSVMNRYYKLLMNTLNNAQKKALKEAQLNWLQYRNKQIILTDAIFAKMEGTMWAPVRVYYRASIVRSRAREIINLYELVKDNL
jgi:uncharacterized protein YecT (DUF1311 family)